MSALLNISIKGKDGKYKNYTISVSDNTNEYGQNVTMFEEQSKEQRLNKEKKIYVGNGKVFWTDGNIKIADKKEDSGDLPF
tara:strand:+ start:2841 stop:3083 length:243 start_codon:yes stop_codon:yes gene_type:complete